MVWVLEGNTKFKPITPSYLKGASGSIIVGDLSRTSTLGSLNQHISLFLEINPQAKIAIALNKADLIAQEKLAKLIENINLKNHSQVINIYPTSAKTGEHVNELFTELSQSII